MIGEAFEFVCWIRCAMSLTLEIFKGRPEQCMARTIQEWLILAKDHVAK